MALNHSRLVHDLPCIALALHGLEWIKARALPALSSLEWPCIRLAHDLLGTALARIEWAQAGYLLVFWSQGDPCHACGDAVCLTPRTGTAFRRSSKDSATNLHLKRAFVCYVQLSAP